MTDVTDSGILTTASDVLFTGGREGYFQALDARTGSLLWKASLGAQIVSGPITYEVDGKRHAAAISRSVALRVRASRLTRQLVEREGVSRAPLRRVTPPSRCVVPS